MLVRGASLAPVIASSGRAGSTMLTDAVAAALLRGVPAIGPALAARSRVRIWMIEEGWDLAAARLRPGGVCKTHDLPPPALPARARVVHTYADPVETALSVLRRLEQAGPAWVAAHLRHLRAPPADPALIEERDILGLAAQFEAWSTPRPYPVLSVQYRAIWDHRAEIADFLGIPPERLVLPPWRRREADPAALPRDRAARLEATYGELAARIAATPPFRRIGPAPGPSEDATPGAARPGDGRGARADEGMAAGGAAAAAAGEARR